MGACFYVWCVKCAKYLAFGTFSTPDGSALNREVLNQISSFSKSRQSHRYLGTFTTVFLDQFLKLIYCVFIEFLPLKYNYRHST